MNRTIQLFFFILIFFACAELPSKEVDKNTTSSEIPTDTLIHQNTESPDLTTTPSHPDHDTTQWTELIQIEPSIIIDLKYATEDNFVEEKMYDCPRCFLRPEVAELVIKAHQQLQEGGLGLKMFDCYRPRPIQQKLWDKVPNASYVTPPSKGSMHNRGAAVDLTIVDQEGNELDMGTAYDFFGRKGHHDFFDLPEEVLKNRQLLKSTMASVGLKHIRTEWWHYSYYGKKYELADMLWACEE